MKEIGGYIEFETFTGKEFHSEAIALNSGRACLEYIIRVREIKKLYIPFYLCRSAQQICEKCNCEFQYYHVEYDFMPVIDFEIQENEYIYIVNYFGQLNNSTLKLLKRKYKNIIIDNTHAFFQTPIEKTDTIYNCRKFFGVPDGGYLYTDVKADFEFETDKSFDRMEHILGRYENAAYEYYDFSKKNEAVFKNKNIMHMSRLTKNLMRGIDYEHTERLRTNNYSCLHRKLKNINKLSIKQVKGCYAYPFMIESAEEIRKKLISEKIYIPILWKSMFDLDGYSQIEEDLVNKILVIPVDQRYNKDDMDYVSKEVLKCLP